MAKIFKYILTISLLFGYQHFFAQDAMQFYYKAVAEKKYGNYQKAVDNLNKAIELNDNDDFFYFLKGDLLRLQNSDNQAIIAYRTALTKGNKEANLRLAKTYAQLNNPDSAVYFLENYLKWYRKKMKYEITSDTDFAQIKNTPQWQKLWSKNYYPPYMIDYQEAYYAYKYNDPTEALTRINNLIKKYKTFSLAYSLKAQILFDGKNYKKSVKFYSKAIELDRKNYDFYVMRAKSYAKLKNYKSAISDIKKSMEINPHNPALFYTLAEYQAADKEYKASLKNISTYCQIFYQDTAKIFRMAEIAFDAGEYLQTIRIINSLSKDKPMTADYFSLRGRAYYMTGRYDLAYYDLSQALDINPQMQNVYYYRGMTAFKQGNIQKACPDWQKAMQQKDYRCYDLYYQNCDK